MDITVSLGTTFFSRAHYISQSQELLDFIPEFTRDAIIVFNGKRYECGISWRNNGKIKGINLSQAEYKNFRKANPSIKEGEISTVRLNVELKILSGLDSAEELIENVRLPIRSGTSEDKFYDILEKMKLIGSRGEESIVLYEKANLIKSKQIGLAKKVERVSKKDIGLGYDILSYDSAGNKKYIEVKTTTTNIDSFEFTITEKSVCSQLREKYFVYFIKNYKLDLKPEQPLDLTIISGSELGNKVILKPSCYTAQLI